MDLGYCLFEKIRYKITVPGKIFLFKAQSKTTISYTVQQSCPNFFSEVTNWVARDMGKVPHFIFSGSSRSRNQRPEKQYINGELCNW